MNIKKHHFSIAAALAVFPFSALSAGEADAFVSVPVTTTESEDEWEFNFAPYLWGAGLSGEVGLGNVTTDIDLSFGDIMENLEIGAMGRFEARKGRWGVMFDGFWLKLEAEGNTPGDLYDGTKVDVDELRLAALVSYRVVDGATTLDLLAGASYFSIDTEIELLPGTAVRRDLSSSEDWVDPVVGFHLHHQFSDRWYAMLRGEIAGFGVGSEFTWQAMVGVGYHFNDCSSLILGYRHLDIDYEDSDFTYDTQTSGVILGVNFAF